MAFGDIGGAVTELIITCRTAKEGDVDIKKGDAVRLIGNYEVDNLTGFNYGSIFGQAMADSDKNDVAIPIKVRGVCRFRYNNDGAAPFVDGCRGITCLLGGEKGTVAAGIGESCERGINLAVNTEEKTVDVLL